MRYHFVTYSEDNYEPSTTYVLQYLKNTLTKHRNFSKDIKYAEIEKSIINYINSLNSFLTNCKLVIQKA